MGEAEGKLTAADVNEIVDVRMLEERGEIFSFRPPPPSSRGGGGRGGGKMLWRHKKFWGGGRKKESSAWRSSHPR